MVDTLHDFATSAGFNFTLTRTQGKTVRINVVIFSTFGKSVKC